MTSISKIISTLIADGIRELKVLAYGGYDVRLVGECLPYGYDTNPVAKAKAFLTKVLGNGNDVIIGYRNTQAKAAPGESRMFATDTDGAFKFNVWVRADGTVLIGDSDEPADYTKHLVMYEELKTAFDQLKTDHNNLVTLYTAHVHSGGILAGALTGTTTPSPTSSTADMSSAKLDNLKTK